MSYDLANDALAAIATYISTVARLTRERDEAREARDSTIGAVQAWADAFQKQSRDMNREAARSETAEAALATARERIAELEGALDPFGRYAAMNDTSERYVNDRLEVPVADLNAARSALARTRRSDDA